MDDGGAGDCFVEGGFEDGFDVIADVGCDGFEDPGRKEEACA